MARQVLGKPTSPHDLNASKVRSLLIQCNVDQKCIDRIGQTFSTTDSAHHAPADYTPHRERIQRYQGYLNELNQILRNAKPAAAIASLTPSKMLPMKRKYPAQADALDDVSNTTAATVISSISPLTKGD
jgi:hypothetical protein